MLVFNGTFRVENSFSNAEKSASGELLSCYLRIIDLSLSRPDICYLKPSIVVAANTSLSPQDLTCIESMGKKIFENFDLELRRTLWIEMDDDDTSLMSVAMLTPTSRSRQDMYDISFRPLMYNELVMLSPFIPESGNAIKRFYKSRIPRHKW